MLPYLRYWFKLEVLPQNDWTSILSRTTWKLHVLKTSLSVKSLARQKSTNPCWFCTSKEPDFLWASPFLYITFPCPEQREGTKELPKQHKQAEHWRINCIWHFSGFLCISVREKDTNPWKEYWRLYFRLATFFSCEATKRCHLEVTSTLINMLWIEYSNYNAKSRAREHFGGLRKRGKKSC